MQQAVFWNLNVHYEITFTLDFIIHRFMNCSGIY